MRINDLHDPAAAAEFIKQFKKRFSAKVCLSPQTNCEGGIISAHTLSVSTMLRPLSRHGKVYTIKANLPARPGQNPIIIALRGLKETSVFNGFCAKHDKILFSPIEDYKFACSREQLFMFAYRAVAKEAYLKRKQAESLATPEDIKEIHGYNDDLEFSPRALLYQAASIKGAEEVERLKKRLDIHLINRDFGRIITTVFEFTSPPPISASFVYAPDFDFHGRYLQDFENFENDLSHLMVSIFPTPTGGFLLLSYEDTANKAPPLLIESLKVQQDISSNVLWFIACQTENFALSPDWFEALSEKDRHAYSNALYTNSNPFDSSINNLQNCNIKIADWNVSRVFTL